MGRFADLVDEPDETTPRANLALRFGAESSPDDAAEAVKLARRYNLPPGVALEFREDYRAKAKADDAKAAIEGAPKLKGWLAYDDNNARMAHDDVQTLAQMEDAVRRFGELKASKGPEASLKSVASGILSAFPQGVRLMSEGVSLQVSDLFDALGMAPDPILKAERMRRMSQEQARVEASTPDFESATARGLYSGGASLLRQVPGIAASIALRSPTPALATMGLQVEAEAYGKYRTRGATPGEALAGGVGEAAVEIATEKLPMGFLVDRFGKTGAKQFLAGMLAREVPSEQAATFLQDAIDTAVANPDKTWGDFMAERPDAAYQTFLATIVQSGVMGTANAVANRLAGPGQSAQQAEDAAAQVEALSKLAEASALRQRDAQTFREFVAEIADERGDAPTELFIDGAALANSLNQSGMTVQEFEAVAPVAAGQLVNAAQTGGMVRVPVAEFATAGEAITSPLIDHLRVSEDAMTRAEAQEYLSAHGDTIQAEVERELQQRGGADAVRQSSEAVRAQLESELNAAGRFTPDVNRAYASLLASFYSTQAQRLGVTPEALLQRYGLRVSAQSVAGAQALNQERDTTAPMAADDVAGQDSAARQPGDDQGATLKRGREFVRQIEALAEKHGRVFIRWSPTAERDLQGDQRSRDFVSGAQHEGLSAVEITGDMHHVDIAKRLAEYGFLRMQDGRAVPRVYLAESVGADSDGYSSIKPREMALEADANVIAAIDARLADILDAEDEIETLRRRLERFGDTQTAGRALTEQELRHQEERLRRLLNEQGAPQSRGVLNQPAYHGTPHRGIEKFSTDKIGTGEGAQAYGWGLYFASKREVAEFYREQLAASLRGWNYAAQARALGIENYEAFRREFHVHADSPAPVGQAAKRIHNASTEARKVDGVTLSKLVEAFRRERDGQLYEVEIPEDDELLHWDKPISEQPPKVLASLRRAYDELAMTFPENAATPKTGRGIYKDIGAGFPELDDRSTDQAASQYLAELGIKGIKYLDGGSRATGDGTYNYVIFSSDDVAIRQQFYQGSDNPRAQISLPPGFTSPAVISLLQGADLSSFVHESGHLFLEIQADLAAKIQAQIDAGASVTEAERGIVADMNTLLQWFGVKGNESLTPLQEWGAMTLDEKRASHEQFARGFEAYAFEGKAPSLELQTVFQRFRSWLVSIYKQLRNLNVELTDDVRAVMGRMLATEAAIEEAEAQRNMGPLFRDAESAGMTLEEYAAYQATGQAATEKAVDELQTRGLRDMKWLSRARDKALKARQQEVDELRREIRFEITREVMRDPVFQAWKALTGRAPKPIEPSSADVASQLDRADWKRRRAEAEESAKKAAHEELYAANPDAKGLEKGRLLAKNRRQIGINVQQRMLEWDAANPRPERVRTEEDIEPGHIGKLDEAAVKIAYPAHAEALASKKMLAKVGADPDVAADVFGFDSGDAMVKALAESPPPEEVIDARTDERMLEMFGDITSQEALNRAADEAVHNEARARFIAAELKALQDAGTVRADTGRGTKTGRRVTVDVMARAAKEYAQQIIARQRIRDVRPGQYAAAEVRSAKLAEKAFAAGKTEEAATHKRNQLINNYATRAAYDAQAEVQSAVRYFRRFDKRSKTIDPAYMDQIEQLLERFEFRPVSLKEIDRRKSLSDWYAEQVKMGAEPNIPPEVLNEANRKSYKDMTLEEINGLRDTVKQIEHLGRLKNRLMLARDQRNFDAIADDMAGSIVANGGKARPVQLEGEKGVIPWLQGVAASHRKLASLFRQMDGGKDHGPMYELIGRAMNERGTMEDVMVEKATVELRKLYDPILKLKGGITGSRSKVFIPAINASLTRGGRLSIALNWGNESNRQRVMSGDGWSEAQVNAILATLTPTELEFVNGVWAYIDTYWEQIAAKEKRLTGVEPEKVNGVPFVVTASDGTQVQMRGGYYPLKYDSDRSDRAASQEAAQVAQEMMQGAFTRATTRRGHTKARLEEVSRPVRKDLNVITQHITQVVHDLAWHEWLIDTNRLLGDERIVDAIRAHYGPKVLKTMRDNVMGIATADAIPQTDIDRALLMLRSNVTRATMGASLTTAFLQPFGLTQSMVRIGPKHVLRGLARWGGDAVRMESTLDWIRGKSEFMRLRSKTFNRELREISGSVAGKSNAMQAIDGGLFWLMQKMQLVADVPTWVGQYEKSIAEGMDDAAAVAMADRAVLEAQGGGQVKDLSEVQRKHPMLTQFYSYFSVTLNLTAERTAATDFKNPRAVAGWLGDMALLQVIPAILPAYILYALKGGDDDDEGMAKRVAEWQLGYLMGNVVGLRELSSALSGFDYAGPPVGRIVSDIGKAGKQTMQGELDEPAVLAYARLMGDAFGIPVAQVIRSYKGWLAWVEGDAPPQAVLLGPPPKD
jgi:hypothetical protein